VGVRRLAEGRAHAAPADVRQPLELVEPAAADDPDRRLACGCGSHCHFHRPASHGGAPAPRRAAARTATFPGAPRTAGPQPRRVLRLALPPRELSARAVAPPR